jgi:sugar phosphate isomerase/epimerase
MELGVSTLSLFKQEFETVIKAIDEYHNIHIWEIIDEGLHRLDKDRIKSLKEYPVKYTIHAPFSDINLASLIDEIRETSVKILLRSLERAYKLEAEVWVVHPGGHSPLSLFFPDRAWKMNIKTLDKLADRARDAGIKMAVENLFGRGRFLKDIEEIKQFLRDPRIEDISLCIDTGHMNITMKEKAIHTIDQLIDRAIEFHIHDNDGTIDSHLKIGAGNLNWRDFFNLIKRAGYTGKLILENLSLEDALDSFKIAKRSLIHN